MATSLEDLEQITTLSDNALINLGYSLALFWDKDNRDVFEAVNRELTARFISNV